MKCMKSNRGRVALALLLLAPLALGRRHLPRNDGPPPLLPGAEQIRVSHCPAEGQGACAEVILGRLLLNDPGQSAFADRLLLNDLAALGVADFETASLTAALERTPQSLNARVGLYGTTPDYLVLWHRGPAGEDFQVLPRRGPARALSLAEVLRPDRGEQFRALLQASGVPAGLSPAQFNWTPSPGGLRLRLPTAGLDFTLPTAALAEVLRPEFLAQLRAFRLHRVEN